MTITRISIAKDFSRFPAGRYDKDGPYNGTKFRKKFLVSPLRAGDHVVVSFDGVAGFGSSFLEEAFGGLVRAEGFDGVRLRTQLEIIADDPQLEDFVQMAKVFIEEA